ncbi:MAG: Phosphoglycerate kinase [Parcubacteria group bacterium GW2011_GWE2_38_18]|nr:MAG: Phosphoglycerate kinase [Parcubacteria group bacterium GW2011_GWE2_38_18]
MKIKSIRQIKNLASKKILLRADFNVPIANGKVKEDYKLIKGLPIIRYLIRYGAKIVIVTHMSNEKLSTQPVAKRLAKILGYPVKFVPYCIGEKVDLSVDKLKSKQILFLQNLRFQREEETNDKKFAKELARPFDIYINDAFGVSHRDHASIGAIKKFIPSFAGFTVEEEVVNLNKALKPKKPLTVIIGGAKISTKVPIIKNFIDKAEYILIGGAIANDFLKSLGYQVGKSLVGSDEKMIKTVIKLYKKGGNKKIILPLDFVVSKKKDGSGRLFIRSVIAVEQDDIILDIGPKTISFYSQFIKKANTIVWNGPMGMFENEKFKHGTMAIAKIVAARSKGQAFGIAGGGETVEALKLSKMFDYVDWVSTGGGAMLDYLGGAKMPGLKGIVKK